MKMESVRSVFGFEEQKEQGFMSDITDDCCELTYEQRLYGFGICFCLGWLLTFLSTLTVGTIATKPEKFAILYTLGNIVALFSTAFLWGPTRQLKSMFKENRYIATSIYLIAMIVTLIVAFKVKSVGFVLLCIVFQFLAMVWYCLSYVPYAREMFKNCLGL